ncbi:hypothetical protein F2Q69_00014860 [Brassica cretica]|uniref:1-acylglycerol-3-phosphate O-acyltransferase n=1 Tax=Brassica cretica TaxID=69181 RepID=A0A8S9R3S9_BRACR|nr:hypothetical protein F2Q69_00014860 [Brassica cretica]
MKIVKHICGIIVAKEKGKLEKKDKAICYVLIRPLSKNTYRKINRVLAETLWLELVWIVDWWAGVKIKVFTDNETFNRMGKEHALVVCNHRSDIDWLVGWILAQIKVFTDNETFNRMGKEHALVVCNHRSDIDWLVGWILAQRSGCLGSALAVTKKSSKFLPSGLQRLKDFPQPFWLALFVEGTRFTETKLKAAQEYAASSELPIPRNVLIPRTKGFVSTVINMRSFVPVIYDMTVATPKSSPPPNNAKTIQRTTFCDEAIAQWCIDQFVAKDALLNKHIAADTFSHQQEQNIGRPMKSLAVVLSWACILTLGAMKFLHWSNLFSSWKGMALSALGLGIITLCMHILIRSSQSGRSSPAKPNDHHHSESSPQTDVEKETYASHITDKFRKITVADIIKCAKVSVIPFAVHMGEVCSVHKLKINLYKPEHYPKHTDITEAHLEETMTVMFLRKLEDAEHAINGIKVDEETGPKSGNETDNDDQAEAKGTEAVDLDADAQKRKKQATDEQGYEESCDDEKNEPSFTSGVDDLVMDNEDENTEVAYCGDPQVIWEELHNQLLNSAE